MVSPYLTFPPQCGCTDPDYLEFNPAAPCDDGSCETLIVFGCSDVNACNYDPLANFNIPELCCYGIDDCNNLDWTLICPALNVDEGSNEMDFRIYPNPTRGNIWLEISSPQTRETEASIYNLQGLIVHRERFTVYQGEQRVQIETETLTQGTYLLRIGGDNLDSRAILIKN